MVQPWAQLLADGRKEYETRSWAPSAYVLKPGALLAITASARMQPVDRDCAEAAGYDASTLPLGCLVAVVRYLGAFRTEALDVSAEENSYGDFTPGRWAWRVELVRKAMVYQRCRGRLGLWEYEPS